MSLTPSRLLVFTAALTAVLVGCSAATSSSTIASPANPAGNVFVRRGSGTQTVVYTSSFDGRPGLGQVFVYPAALGRHPSSPMRTIENGTVRPYGMWVDSAGTLYVVNIPQGAPTTGIAEFHPGSNFPFKTLNGGLWYPTEVAVGKNGAVYVNERLANNCSGDCVAIYAPGSDSIARTVPMNFDGYALQSDQMAFDRGGNLLVGASTFKDGYHIFRMNVNTFKVTELKLDVTGLGPGLGADGAGNIYVSGAYANEIAVFAPGATSPTYTMSPGAQDLTVMPDGTVYAATGAGVNEYKPGGNTPVNTIDEPAGNLGFGIAVGPN